MTEIKRITSRSSDVNEGFANRPIYLYETCGYGIIKMSAQFISTDQQTINEFCRKINKPDINSELSSILRKQDEIIMKFRGVNMWTSYDYQIYSQNNYNRAFQVLEDNKIERIEPSMMNILINKSILYDIFFYILTSFISPLLFLIGVIVTYSNQNILDRDHFLILGIFSFLNMMYTSIVRYIVRLEYRDDVLKQLMETHSRLCMSINWFVYPPRPPNLLSSP